MQEDRDGVELERQHWAEFVRRCRERDADKALALVDTFFPGRFTTDYDALVPTKVLDDLDLPEKAIELAKAVLAKPSLADVVEDAKLVIDLQALVVQALLRTGVEQNGLLPLLQQCARAALLLGATPHRLIAVIGLLDVDTNRQWPAEQILQMHWGKLQVRKRFRDEVVNDAIAGVEAMIASLQPALPDDTSVCNE